MVWESADRTGVQLVRLALRALGPQHGQPTWMGVRPGLYTGCSGGEAEGRV